MGKERCVAGRTGLELPRRGLLAQPGAQAHQPPLVRRGVQVETALLSFALLFLSFALFLGSRLGLQLLLRCLHQLLR
eukprot:COSAG04_NODE_18944_length_428_cov_1.416413_2_plen_76_part_01